MTTASSVSISELDSVSTGITWRPASPSHPPYAKEGEAYMNTLDDTCYLYSEGKWHAFFSELLSRPIGTIVPPPSIEDTVSEPISKPVSEPVMETKSFDPFD